MTIGAAQFLRANAQANDWVLAFGNAAPHNVMGLGSYLARENSMRVLEPQAIDGAAVKEAKQQIGRAWGILFTPNAQDLEQVRALGGDRVEILLFRNLALVSPRPTSPQETIHASARRLVGLYRAVDVERMDLAAVILDDPGQEENLLANPSLAARGDARPRAWFLGETNGSVVMSDGMPVLQLTSARDDGRAIAQQQVALVPGRFYIFRFECRSSLTRGAQRTDVTFPAREGGLITFPTGAGHVCPNNADWRQSAFVVRAPLSEQGDALAKIVVGNGGIGVAEWRNLSLYKARTP